MFRLHVVSRQQTALGTISVLNVGCLDSCDDLLTVFHVRFEVFTFMLLKIQVFWNVMPCQLVNCNY